MSALREAMQSRARSSHLQFQHESRGGVSHAPSVGKQASRRSGYSTSARPLLTRLSALRQGGRKVWPSSGALPLNFQAARGCAIDTRTRLRRESVSADHELLSVDPKALFSCCSDCEWRIDHEASTLKRYPSVLYGLLPRGAYELSPT